MRAVIVTQEEPFYIPVFLGKVLAEYRGAMAVIILPGIPSGVGSLSYARTLYALFGFRDFLVYGILFIRHKILDFLSQFKQLRRFYSVQCSAKRSSIPVYKLKNINDQRSLSLLKALEPEVIISVAAPQVFKKELISLTKYVINIHAALLPEYRGMSPCFWVLAKGEMKTGITVHYINEKIDLGDIILQDTIDISDRETYHSLQCKVASLGATTLLKTLGKIERGDAAGVAPEGEGSYYSSITKEAVKEFRARGRRFI